MLRHSHVIFREHVFITWRWQYSVETCRSVAIYKLIVIVLLLIILQNNKKMHGTCIKIKMAVLIGIHQRDEKACSLKLQGLLFDHLDLQYEGTRSSETSVTVYPSKRRHIPEKWDLQTDYTRLPRTGLQPLLRVAENCVNLLRIKRIPDIFWDWYRFYTAQIHRCY